MPLLVVMVLTRAASAAVGVTAKIGTLGVGGDLTVGLFSQLNARLGVNYLNLDLQRDDAGGKVKEISAALDLKTVAALLDWHPNGWNFRVSGGAMINKNKLALSAKPGENVKIDDIDFAVNSVEGEATFKDLAPYLGIGYGNAGTSDKDTHWRFAFDLGVMFQGEPDIKLSATAANPSVQPLLDQAVANETVKVKDDAKPFNMYPVLSFGVSYVF